MRIWLIGILLTALITPILDAGALSFYERLQAKVLEEYGELEQGEVVLREKQKPGAGIMLYFSSETSAASIYIYDRKLGPIPEGAESELLLREFNYNLGLYQLRATGEDAIQQGPVPISDPLFENLTIEASGQVMPLNNLNTRYARLRYEQNGIPYIEHIFMTGHKGHFWLFTYAYAEEFTAIGELQMAGFIDNLPTLTR